MKEIKDIVKTVPKEAWTKLASTACDTFEKLIYPLTATTEGIGKLIENKFNKLEDAKKVIAAKCFEEASRKINNSNKYIDPHTVVKPTVIYEALENTDAQTDQTMRSLWANLLANEFATGNVHPEIAKLLTRITSKDALLLLEVSKNEDISLPIRVLKALASKYSLERAEKSFNHVHLENIGLIRLIETDWYLTIAGKEFLACVSDLE